MRYRHRLGWKTKLHMPRLESMVRTAVSFHRVWGWKWAVDFLTAALVGEQSTKHEKLRQWNKWRMYKRD